MEVTGTAAQFSGETLKAMVPGRGGARVETAHAEQRQVSGQDGNLDDVQQELDKHNRTQDRVRRIQKQEQEEISSQRYLKMLRRLNLSYNLFEVQSDYKLSSELELERIVIRNTATDKVIRKIPPHERLDFPAADQPPVRQVDVSG